MTFREMPHESLVHALQAVNRRRESGQGPDPAAVAARFDAPDTRLAVYGSLAPGEVNHQVITDIPGAWREGVVRGSIRQEGWGALVGFPGMTWRPHSEEQITVKLFVSSALEAHWPRIDEFEGSDYLRILVPVEGVAAAPVIANIYQLRD